MPRDPAFPDDRLAYMLEDSGATVLLAGGGHAGRFPRYSVSLVTFEEGMTFPANDGPARHAAVTPENLA